MKFIKRVDENKNVTNYENIKEAALAVDTNFDLWKVEMLLQSAVRTGKPAFKSKWSEVEVK